MRAEEEQQKTGSISNYKEKHDDLVSCESYTDEETAVYFLYMSSYSEMCITEHFRFT